MPNRNRTHHSDAVHGLTVPDGRTPLEQALIESSELKLLLFKTFATLSTYASGFADGGAQARKTLDMLHQRMYVGGLHDLGHGEDDQHAADKPPQRQAS